MKIKNLKDDIRVFYVTAESFPDGIKAAHEKLRSLLPSSKGRRFYGISYEEPNGKIIYKAATEELQGGEAEQYGCERFTIKSGDYLSERLKNWQKDETMVAKTFRKILSDPRIDKNGYCLEVYLNETDMDCMVPLESY